MTQRISERIDFELFRPDSILSALVGGDLITWYQVILALAQYGDENGLWVPDNPELIKVDAKLKLLVSEKDEVTFDHLVESATAHLSGTGLPANDSPSTYLLTWNPKRFLWKNLQDLIDRADENGYTPGGWTCGRCKRVRVGDRVFLSRQGEEPKGIMASGTVISNAKEEEHWDPGKEKKGHKTYGIDIEWDTMLDPAEQALLSREQLMEEFPEVHWDTQISGIGIKEEVATRLEDMWNDHLEDLGYELVE